MFKYPCETQDQREGNTAASTGICLMRAFELNAVPVNESTVDILAKDIVNTAVLIQIGLLSLLDT